MKKTELDDVAYEVCIDFSEPAVFTWRQISEDIAAYSTLLARLGVGGNECGVQPIDFSTLSESESEELDDHLQELRERVERHSCLYLYKGHQLQSEAINDLPKPFRKELQEFGESFARITRKKLLQTGQHYADWGKHLSVDSKIEFLQYLTNAFLAETGKAYKIKIIHDPDINDHRAHANRGNIVFSTEELKRRPEYLFGTLCHEIWHNIIHLETDLRHLLQPSPSISQTLKNLDIIASGDLVFRLYLSREESLDLCEDTSAHFMQVSELFPKAVEAYFSMALRDEYKMGNGKTLFTKISTDARQPKYHNQLVKRPDETTARGK